VKENECSDSAGKRCRSSTPGVPGLPGRTCAETDLEDDIEMGSVFAWRSGEGVKCDSTGLEGLVDVLEVCGSPRILRSPDTPMTLSCSLKDDLRCVRTAIALSHSSEPLTWPDCSSLA